MDELAKRFADLANQYGPSVANAALESVRVEVYSTLAASLLWMGVTGGIGYLAWFIWRRRPVKKEDGFLTDNDTRLFLSILACLMSSVACALFLCALWTWIDPWTWAALNHPELYLAKRVFLK